MTDLNDWLNTTMPDTVKKLEESIVTKYHSDTGDYLGLAGCAEDDAAAEDDVNSAVSLGFDRNVAEDELEQLKAER